MSSEDRQQTEKSNLEEIETIWGEKNLDKKTTSDILWERREDTVSMKQEQDTTKNEHSENLKRALGQSLQQVVVGKLDSYM